MAHAEHVTLHVGSRTLEGYRSVDVESERGTILMRWYEAAWGDSAVIYAGGVGGGFDSPGAGLYPHLASDLAAHGMAGLRVSYRDPLDIDEARFDVLAGVSFLRSEGVRRIGLVGHSFGGAVAIQAASEDRSVRTVVAISSQGHGADAVERLPVHCSLLLLHGEADDVVHPSTSGWIHSHAQVRKRLVLLPGGSHVLDESAKALYQEVSTWLADELGTE